MGKGVGNNEKYREEKERGKEYNWSKRSQNASKWAINE